MLSSTLKKLERKFFYMVVMKSYLSDLQSTWSRSRSYFWRAGAGAEKIERLRNTAKSYHARLFGHHVDF